MVLEKSDTKDQFPMDDIQSKETSTTSVDMPQEINDCYSEFIEGSGETIDSQEPIRNRKSIQMSLIIKN